MAATDGGGTGDRREKARTTERWSGANAEGRRPPPVRVRPSPKGPIKRASNGQMTKIPICSVPPSVVALSKALESRDRSLEHCALKNISTISLLRVRVRVCLFSFASYSADFNCLPFSTSSDGGGDGGRHCQRARRRLPALLPRRQESQIGRRMGGGARSGIAPSKWSSVGAVA